MLRSVFSAIAFGLIIPVVGYLVGNWILGDLNSTWEGAQDGMKIEAFCSLFLSELTGETKSACQEIIHIDYLRTASIWSGAIFVGLIALYFIASVICGTNRALIATVFPLLVPITSFVIAISIFVQGAILTYAAWQGESYAIGQVHVVLIGGIGVAALAAGFKLLGALLSFKSKAETTVFGKPLSKEEAKNLWGFVEEIAEKLGAQRPNNILVGLQPTFYVTSADINVSPDRQKLKGESLYLSLPLMRLFKKEELAAVIGHELGHFKGSDTAYSLKFAPVYSGLATSIKSLDDGDSGIAAIPAIAALRAMFDIFTMNEKKISRIREFEADRAGISVSSNVDLAHSLAKVVVLSSVWEKVRAENVERLNDNRVTRNLSEVFEDSAKYDVAHSSIDEIIEEVLPAQITHPTDSHPAISERFENISFDIANMDLASLAKAGGSASALLGESLYSIEEELTLIEHQIMVALGYVSPKEASADERPSSLLNAIYILAATMVGADGKIQQSEVKKAEEIGKQLIASFDEVEFRSVCKNFDDVDRF